MKTFTQFIAEASGATIQKLLKTFGTTTNARETMFLLTDGRRISAKPAVGKSYTSVTHVNAVGGGRDGYLAQLDMLDDGVIRYAQPVGDGVEVGAVPTEIQAKILADDWNVIFKRPLHLEVSGRTSRSFDPPIKPDALRNFVKGNL